MRFRPGDLPEGDPTKPNTPVEWEDNALSNTFAYLSYKLVPSWCQTPEHWTSRVTQYLFTDCPCCLLFRGIVVGMMITWILAALLFLFLLGLAAASQ